MIRAIIVEDEPLAREYLRSLLAGTGRVEVVGEASDGAAGLKLCRELTPDAAFLDIEVPGADGLDLAGRLLTLPRPPLVVFVTGYSGHAVDAFRVEAVDYLLKPIDDEQMREAVRRLEDRLATRSAARLENSAESEGDRLAIRDPASGAVRLFGRREGVALLRRGRRTWVHTTDGAYPTHVPLATLARQLGGDPFLRLSRDAVVNLDAVAAVRRVGDRQSEVELRDHARTRVEASRTGSALLAEQLRTHRPS